MGPIARMFGPIRGASSELVMLDVEFMLMDRDYRALSGVPVRLVLGQADWQRPDAGQLIVTDAKGGAAFTTTATVDRRWQWVNVGFTPFSTPQRTHHLMVAVVIDRILPGTGGDMAHTWLYTIDVDRFGDGNCATGGLNEIWAAEAGGSFTKKLAEGAASPTFIMLVDGLMLNGPGYLVREFTLSPEAGDVNSQQWHLKLSLVRMPKPTR